jgi:hypothetical protein
VSGRRRGSGRPGRWSRGRGPRRGRAPQRRGADAGRRGGRRRRRRGLPHRGRWGQQREPGRRTPCSPPGRAQSGASRLRPSTAPPPAAGRRQDPWGGRREEHNYSVDLTGSGDGSEGPVGMWRTGGCVE